MSFCNLLGCLYLERHNFDHRTTFQLSGSVSVISGRTSAHRTSIVQCASFLRAFVNDYCFFGLVGPLNADDDTFITRWNVNRGWKLGYQDRVEARVETTIGDEGGFGKFLSQNVRWMRTAWRSNLTSLFAEGIIWNVSPWCFYSVYLTSLVNFALFYDGSLVFTLYLAVHQLGSRHMGFYMFLLLSWILTSKMVKTAPYFYRHPRDLVYLPGCILFGYCHSFIKFFALLTFWQTAWGSRKLGDEIPSETVMGHGVSKLKVDEGHTQCLRGKMRVDEGKYSLYFAVMGSFNDSSAHMSSRSSCVGESQGDGPKSRN